MSSPVMEGFLNLAAITDMKTSMLSGKHCWLINDQKLFNSCTDIHQLILNVDTIGTLSSSGITQLLHIFKQYGFVILQCHNFNDSEVDFIQLSKIFGKITGHNRANRNGIVSIKPLPNYPAYLGASNLPHPLHTDGPFEKNPPKVVALQCETPDPVGGLNQIVSCRSIYQYLRHQDPDGLQLLFNPNVFAIQRDQQFERRAVFEYINGKISMAFRTNDGKANIFIMPEAIKVFDLILSFIDDPQNCLSFKLERGQILVIDNSSVLHGRTGFSKDSPRSLKRLNFDGESEYTPMLAFGFEP